MKRVVLVFFLLFLFQKANSQYTEIINSKRPGFSESPYSIGSNVYQIESGFFYSKSDNTDFRANPKTYGGTAFLRIGKFSEKFEINAKIDYTFKEANTKNFVAHMDPLYEFGNTIPVILNDKTGFNELTIGAKYLLYQQEYTDKSKEVRSMRRRMAFDKKRLIPSVGVYLGVHTDFLLSNDYKDQEMSYKGALLLQNDFSDQLVVLTNLVADNISTDDKNYSYIVTMTYAMNMLWSFFIENQGKYQKHYAPQYQFGTGLAYLFTENLQLDASIRTNFFEDYSYTYLAAGFAWRLDRHVDQIIYTDNTPKLNIKNKPRKRKKNKKGFFSRIFGKKKN